MSDRVNALVIGCGRIGAGSGTRQQRASSHAGVISSSSAFNLHLFDDNRSITIEAAEVLGARALEEVQTSHLSGFGLVAVCTPTKTHSEYLTRLLSAEVPLIVCEKPICDTMLELEAAVKAQSKGSSRVLVNYIRRFQPAYLELRSKLSQLSKEQELRACTVRYQRGFLNNGSHAISLLQFLLGWKIEDATFEVASATADEILDDATISGFGVWNGASFSMVGLPYVRFSLFEIDLFYERDAVRISDRGDTIETAVSSEKREYYSPLQTEKCQTGCLEEPMVNLYRFVEKMIASQTTGDNFAEAVALTRWMLQVREAA